MALDRAALVDAIADPFSEAHGAGAAEMLAQLGQGSTVGLLDAGLVLGAVLAELPPANALATMRTMTLTGANVATPKGAGWFDAEATAANLAFGRWTAKTAGDQLAAAIMWGADMIEVDPTAPRLASVTAVRIGQSLAGFFVTLDFPASESTVTLHFGKPDELTPRRILYEVGGLVILGVGEHLRNVGADPFEMPGGPPPAAPDAPEASPTVH